jgi:hypothetical protein
MVLSVDPLLISEGKVELRENNRGDMYLRNVGPQEYMMEQPRKERSSQ